MQKLPFVLLVLTVGACSSSPDTSSSTGEIMGTAVYRDSMTDHAGAPQQPAAPPPQSANVSIVIKGSGTIPQVDPRCATDPVGAFEAHYAGSAQLANDRAYTAAIASGAGSLTTPSGCAVSNLTVGAISDVVVRAALAVNTENCQTYCAASARADAEAQCGSTADQATCRADAESSAAAACQTTCTTQAHSIAAEVSLGAAALGQVSADQLQAAAFGDLSANLTFDHLEDASGNPL